MQNLLQRLPREARVVVVRLRSLGDCVLTTPALSILKQARPDLKIGVVVEDAFRPVFEGNPDVDQLFEPSPAPVARWRPELCVNFHGGTRSLALTFGSRARYRAGFSHFRYSSLYNICIPRAQEILGVKRVVHTAEHLASAMFYLGAPRREIPRAQLFAGAPPPGDPYAVIHPLAAAADKTWPADRFVEVAEHLRSAWRLDPVFIGGPGDDLSPFRKFRCLSGAPLAEVKTLLRGAALFLGNDSGPAHMAAAFQVPLAVLYGSSDPVIWAPWRAVAQTCVGQTGIQSIEVSTVLEALDRLRVTA